MAPPGYRAAVERALPGTLAQLVAKSSMRIAVVRKWVRIMREEGACHVGAWEHVQAGRGVPSVAQVFVAGPGADVPLVAGAAHADIVLKRDRCRDMVIAALPGSRMQVMAKTGLSKGTVCRWIKDLHAGGLVHIVNWKRPAKGPFMPIYAAGAGVDAVCKLKHFTTAEKATRYRGKARNNGTWAERTRQQRGRYWAGKAAERGDPLVNALFGRN